MTQEEFLALEPYFRGLFLFAVGLMGLLFFVRVIQYILYVRSNRQKNDYWNNKPEGGAWWKIGLASILGFLWFVFVTRNKALNELRENK